MFIGLWRGRNWLFSSDAQRNNAFDFNVALTDHKRDLDREAEVAKIKHTASLEPQIDFSFKEGEKITINVQAKTADGQEAKRSGRRAAQPGGGGSGMLPPPPSAKTSIRYAHQKQDRYLVFDIVLGLFVLLFSLFFFFGKMKWWQENGQWKWFRRFSSAAATTAISTAAAFWV